MNTNAKRIMSKYFDLSSLRTLTYNRLIEWKYQLVRCTDDEIVYIKNVYKDDQGGRVGMEDEIEKTEEKDDTESGSETEKDDEIRKGEEIERGRLIKVVTITIDKHTHEVVKTITKYTSLTENERLEIMQILKDTNTSD